MSIRQINLFNYHCSFENLNIDKKRIEGCRVRGVGDFAFGGGNFAVGGMAMFRMFRNENI